MFKKIGVAAAVFVVFASSWLVAQEGSGHPDRGEAIYREHCIRCHGKMGDGHGPDAADLIVQPVDFHSSQSRARTD